MTDAEAGRPLEGVGVVVTRDEASDEGLSGALRRLGARVLHWPTIRGAPAADPAPLLAALHQVSAFDWVVFTSGRAVAAVADILDAPPVGPRLAAVGESTADAARRRGWRIEVVPPVQTAESLVTALAHAGVDAGSRVLFPASEIAGPTVEAGLASLGAEVERVTAYRTLTLPLDRDGCRRALVGGKVHVISFTSPSSLEGLRRGLGPDLFAEAAARVTMAAIGPTTAAAIRAAGATHVIEAANHSLPGLVERIVAWAGAHHREEKHELSDQ